MMSQKEKRRNFLKIVNICRRNINKYIYIYIYKLLRYILKIILTLQKKLQSKIIID